MVNLTFAEKKCAMCKRTNIYFTSPDMTNALPADPTPSIPPAFGSATSTTTTISPPPRPPASAATITSLAWTTSATTACGRPSYNVSRTWLTPGEDLAIIGVALWGQGGGSDGGGSTLIPMWMPWNISGKKKL